jgi:hypothetical protein
MTKLALVYPRAGGLVAGRVEFFDLRLPGSSRIDVDAVDLGVLAGGGPRPHGLSWRSQD